MCIVSKRARVSYGAPVCRVMHADPETTSEYGTLRVSYRSCRILERCSLAPKLFAWNGRASAMRSCPSAFWRPLPTFGACMPTVPVRNAHQVSRRGVRA